MAREGTKTAAAIAVMVAHKSKPMEEVLPLIAKATGHDLPHARNYYVWCVRKGVAPGIVPVKAKAPKAPKAAKAKAEKAVKAVKQPKAKAPKQSDKLAAIRAENLRRMKEVAAKRKLPDPVDISDEAMDSFTVPKFLTKDQLKVLV